MPSLDAVSIAIFLWIMSAVLAVVMTLLWRWEHTQHGFGFWVFSQWALSLGLLFLLLRLVLPMWISVLFGNGLILCGLILIRAGFLRYRGLRIAVGFDTAVALVTTTALSIAYWADVVFHDRMVLAAGAGAVLALRCLASLRPTPPKMKVAFRAAQLLCLAAAILSGARALMTVLMASESTALFENSVYQGLILLGLAILALLVPFVLLIFNSLRNLDQLQHARAAAESAAATDYLTGLANRRAMFEALEHMPGESRLALCLMDIDDFKQVNDRYGHGAGDRALASLGTIMREQTLEHESLVRLGGEEFVIMAATDDFERMVRLAETLRGRIERELAMKSKLDGQITCSLGVASGRADEIDAIMARADAALYEAKRAGKNQVRTFTDETASADAIDTPQYVSFRTRAKLVQPQRRLVAGVPRR